MVGLSLHDRVLRALVGALPRVYFRPPPGSKQPVAPVWRALASFSLEVSVVVACFAFMIWYFATAPTPTTTITSSLLPGQACSVLNPKRGTVYFSKTHSENAQFAKPTNLTSQQCEALLSKLDVCGDGRRLDVLNLWGISNPNNSQYFRATASAATTPSRPRRRRA